MVVCDICKKELEFFEEDHVRIIVPDNGIPKFMGMLCDECFKKEINNHIKEQK